MSTFRRAVGMLAAAAMIAAMLVAVTPAPEASAADLTPILTTLAQGAGQYATGLGMAKVISYTGFNDTAALKRIESSLAGINSKLDEIAAQLTGLQKQLTGIAALIAENSFTQAYTAASPLVSKVTAATDTAKTLNDLTQSALNDPTKSSEVSLNDQYQRLKVYLTEIVGNKGTMNDVLLGNPALNIPGIVPRLSSAQYDANVFWTTTQSNRLRYLYEYCRSALVTQWQLILADQAVAKGVVVPERLPDVVSSHTFSPTNASSSAPAIAVSDPTQAQQQIMDSGALRDLRDTAAAQIAAFDTNSLDIIPSGTVVNTRNKTQWAVADPRVNTIVNEWIVPSNGNGNGINNWKLQLRDWYVERRPHPMAQTFLDIVAKSNGNLGIALPRENLTVADLERQPDAYWTPSPSLLTDSFSASNPVTSVFARAGVDVPNNGLEYIGYSLSAPSADLNIGRHWYLGIPMITNTGERRTCDLHLEIWMARGVLYGDPTGECTGNLLLTRSLTNRVQNAHYWIGQ